MSSCLSLDVSVCRCVLMCIMCLNNSMHVSVSVSVFLFFCLCVVVSVSMCV